MFRKTLAFQNNLACFAHAEYEPTAIAVLQNLGGLLSWLIDWLIALRYDFFCIHWTSHTGPKAEFLDHLSIRLHRIQTLVNSRFHIQSIILNFRVANKNIFDSSNISLEGRNWLRPLDERYSWSRVSPPQMISQVLFNCNVFLSCNQWEHQDQWVNNLLRTWDHEKSRWCWEHVLSKMRVFQLGYILLGTLFQLQLLGRWFAHITIIIFDSPAHSWWVVGWWQRWCV